MNLSFQKVFSLFFSQTKGTFISISS